MKAANQVIALAVLCVAASTGVHAQTAIPRLDLGFGVDTSITVVRSITSLVRAYLERPDSSAGSRGLWSPNGHPRRSTIDPAAQAYQGFPATLVAVTGVGNDESLYVVKVLYATADSTGARIRPLALQRFDAVRAEGSPFGWQLASPLLRSTKTWARRSYGPVTFWYAPGVTPSPPRARQAATFVDSVASLFGVQVPTRLDAYVTATVDDGERLLGLDFFPNGSGPGTGLGGRSLSAAKLLLLGDPVVGEAYRHEFVHAVLESTLRPKNGVASEGIATWLGGSRGKTRQQLYEQLAHYQRSHPDVTIQQVLEGEGPGGAAATLALYATNALIVDAVYRNGGIDAVKRFAATDGTSTEVSSKLPTFLGRKIPDLTVWWRQTVSAFLGG